MDLFVFSVQPRFVADVVSAGAAGVVVDWERRGKARRQAGHDTQINADTADDLARVRAATSGRVLCRLNAVGPWTAGEVEAAVACGADEVLLPMVRDVAEVDRALELAVGRVGVGILVETVEAVVRAPQLLARPLSRVYVGLNDLRIARGATQLFAPLVDGTVDAVRRAAGALPFGVAGLTVVDGGAPVPCLLLAHELVRLDASFTFLRRSFLADVQGRDLRSELDTLHAALAASAGRTADERDADARALAAAVRPVLLDAQPA